MRAKFVLSVIILLCAYNNVYAQGRIKTSDKYRPQWIRSSEIYRENINYRIVSVEDIGPQLNDLLKNRATNLANYIESSQKIDGVQNRKINIASDQSGKEIANSYSMSFTTHTETRNFKCQMIDNYWELVNLVGSGPQYRLFTCYAIADSEYQSINDTFSTSSQYGARGLWRSAIVPGWGQMYKGSFAKGGIIMGGTVALAAGIVVGESMRKDFVTKAAQTHSTDAARQYQANANNATLARNICIGGIAALYIYNLVDAVVAPGGKRVIVTPVSYGGNQFGIQGSINF